MDFTATSHFDKRSGADVLIVPYVKLKGKPALALKNELLKKELKAPLAAGDFRANEGELLWVYPDAGIDKRIVLLGLGEDDKVDIERLRRAYGAVSKACIGKKLSKVNVCFPDALKLVGAELAQGIVEGFLLTNYSFTGNKSLSKDKPSLINKISLLGASAAITTLAKKYVSIFNGVYFARDLVNGNADDVTPQGFAAIAKELAKDLPLVKATVFDKKRLEKEKFGLILAVSRGSCREPVMIVVEYKGAPKSKEHTVFVGKGITYDTGGLNLKPTGSMETMRADMAGAAAALGALIAASTLGLKRNITVVIPSTENSIDACSYKPGDVYTGYAGKSVEIGNTDAEGRLVLADALAYTVKTLKPTRIVDLATLTGAMDVALGSEYMGLFSNDDALSSQLEKASMRTYERMWRLPLVEEYREQLKSDIADLKNIGGRGAGSIKGALFLEEFVGSVPWAHLDIAAVAYATEAKRYLPKYGTGIGVRLLVDFLENL